jgi:hypothetical protein
MKSRIGWFFAGIVLAVILGALLVVPAVANAENGQTAFSMADFAKIYRQALVSSLNKVKSEIKDPSTADFYSKLLQAFDLENATTANGSTDNFNLADLLPDLGKIEKAAIETPLKEAVKQLKDKDLVDFYNAFLSKCGVNN